METKNTNEEKPYVFISDTDEKLAEELVEKSGIKIWLQPKTWRQKIVDNKKTAIAIALTVVLILGLVTTITAQALTIKDKNVEIADTKHKLKMSESDLADAISAKDEAESDLAICQDTTETAWKAWNRRNDLVVSVFSNLFGVTNSSAIDNDNTLAASEFLIARTTCNRNMDASEIFSN